MASLDQVVTRLGIVNSDQYVSNLHADNKWKSFVPYRLQKGLEEIAPDSLFVSEGKVLILFFDFTTEARGRAEISQKIWNLGGVPIVYFITEDEVIIYNGYLFNVEHKNFQPLSIHGRQVEEINYWDIVSGKIWTELSTSRGSRVDEAMAKRGFVNTGIRNQHGK